MAYDAVNPSTPTAIVREVDVKLEINWGGALGWTDESANLMSVSGAQENAPPHELYVGSKVIIQSAKITLSNRSKRYSPWYSSGPLYTYIKDGGYYHKPVRLSFKVGAGGSWAWLFHGYVKLPDERYAENTVVLEVWDRGEMLRQRYSTAMYKGYTDHDLVKAYLQLAGLVDGVDFISQQYNPATATLDYSTMTIPWSWLDDEPIWDELADVAQAANAQIYVGPDGMVYYRKGWRWAVPDAGGTLDMGDFTNLQPYFRDRTYYDEIRVSYAARRLGFFKTDLWEMTDHKLILPGAKETVEARFSYPAVLVNEMLKGISYKFRTLWGDDLDASFSETITLYGQQAIFEATNNGSVPGVLGKFKFVGVPLVGTPSEQVKKKIETTLDAGRRLDVRENPYVQSKLQAQLIADFLAWWYALPKATYRLEGVRGDPARRIGQRITITANSLSATAIITRIEWQIRTERDRIQYTQTIEALADVFTTGATEGYHVINSSVVTAGKRMWL